MSKIQNYYSGRPVDSDSNLRYDISSVTCSVWILHKYQIIMVSLVKTPFSFFCLNNNWGIQINYTINIIICSVPVCFLICLTVETSVRNRLNFDGKQKHHNTALDKRLSITLLKDFLLYLNLEKSRWSI